MRASKVKAGGKATLNADYPSDTETHLTREPPSHDCDILHLVSYGTVWEMPLAILTPVVVFPLKLVVLIEAAGCQQMWGEAGPQRKGPLHVTSRQDRGGLWWAPRFLKLLSFLFPA